ncbi:MAG: type II toxin-antitoxin system RelE/ParE family toxin [Nitrospinae bacterium]|nr:type II toxin-antitoxin system RelE/ParE family toxin [Nitrospinota bacterium]
MAWRVEFSTPASEELFSLDVAVQRRIAKYLRDRISTEKDPRRFGKPLLGDKKGLWCYRVGDYRLISLIKESVKIVTIFRVGHRRNIYD